ncbi:MAG: V-type ATPase subunit [Verrucomicrobia bacterium]|nr:V-type ATPase subunit [Verrucomicrobiota bacterium]
MRGLARYAYINAKLRARLSLFLTDTQFRQLAAAADLETLYGMLAQTRYGAVARELSHTEDMISVEFRLLIDELATYQTVLQHVRGVPRLVVETMMSRHEVDKLKVLLRLWHTKDPRAEHLAYPGVICRPLPAESIRHARSVDELIGLLDGTPYARPLQTAAAAFAAHGNLFYLESALDVDYYSRLWSAIARLGFGDRERARTLVGLEIDIENICWMLRLQHYYKMPLGEMLALLIPNGARVSEPFVRRAAGGGDLKHVVGAALGELVSDFPDVTPIETEVATLEMMEDVLWHYYLGAVRKGLHGYPFTITTVMGYLKLAEIERRNLVCVLNGKRYGLTPAEIERNLILQMTG